MMGNSAGRSKANRTAENATRRGTPRERAQVDPPFPHEEQGSRWTLTERGHSVVNALAWALWLGTCVFLAVLVAAWWGWL